MNSQPAHTPATSEGYPLVQQMIGHGELLDEATFQVRAGLSAESLDRQLADHKVFFLDFRGVRYFSAFYAGAAYDRRHLSAVTKVLANLPAGAKLLFFLNPKGSLGSRTALEALRRGEVAAVKRAAQGLAEA